VYSNTWDEPEHLAAGIELLDRGQYEYDTEHPPFGRVLLALGRTSPGRALSAPRAERHAGRHRYPVLRRALRALSHACPAGVLPFLALLLFATWLWARRLFRSQGAALLCVLLLVSVPAVLGHAALASLDVARLPPACSRSTPCNCGW